MLLLKIFIILNQTAGYEDFIFLILIILATAAQAYAQYRKKEMMKKGRKDIDGKDIQREEEEEEYSPIFRKFREAMGNEFFDEDEAKAGDYTITEKKKSIYRVEKDKTTVSAKVYAKPEKPSYVAGVNKGKMKVAKIKSGKGSYKRSIKKNFNLRNAVIYSEILNRKY